MCLILFATDAHARYALIVAANRDEAYSRAAAPAAFWEDCPQLYGGRDLEQGGTWLGLSRTGRFAAITNYRAASRSATARSRGELTREFLVGNEGADRYLQRVSRRADEYNGFSLIVGTPTNLYFFSNRGAATEPIGAGVHGLSNHLLNEPWPKVSRGKAALASLLDAPAEEIVSRMHAALADRTPAADALLPSTGVGLQRERDLSPAFIAGEHYGTRASTVVLVSRNGDVLFSERSFGARGAALSEREQRFVLDETPTPARPKAPARA